MARNIHEKGGEFLLPLLSSGGRLPLTEKQIQQIVTLFKGGERAVDIAKA
ncbi:hypothetical protein [Priestia megaterium]|nr:hypothetical protein [Priestia megaterium]